ncbi:MULTISPECIES: hypothetical protein [unclassified Mesorhizobium]|nr:MULTISPECIES: hypothetical protein [unclassified Mesorhizobium]
MSKDRDSEGPVFSGQDARQGEIILRTRAVASFSPPGWWASSCWR